jgi:hypothetical protein
MLNGIILISGDRPDFDDDDDDVVDDDVSSG